MTKRICLDSKNLTDRECEILRDSSRRNFVCAADAAEVVLELLTTINDQRAAAREEMRELGECLKAMVHAAAEDATARIILTAEELAIDLHRETRRIERSRFVHPEHDHGWKACSRKEYFRKRAAAILEKGGRP